MDLSNIFLHYSQMGLRSKAFHGKTGKAPNVRCRGGNRAAGQTSKLGPPQHRTGAQGFKKNEGLV